MSGLSCAVVRPAKCSARVFGGGGCSLEDVDKEHRQRKGHRDVAHWHARHHAAHAEYHDDRRKVRHFWPRCCVSPNDARAAAGATPLLSAHLWSASPPQRSAWCRRRRQVLPHSLGCRTLPLEKEGSTACHVGELEFEVRILGNDRTAAHAVKPELAWPKHCDAAKVCCPPKPWSRHSRGLGAPRRSWSFVRTRNLPALTAAQPVTRMAGRPGSSSGSQ